MTGPGCPFCHGSGESEHGSCRECGGTGKAAWRCECGDLNRPWEWSCYRCGAGHQEYA